MQINLHPVKYISFLFIAIIGYAPVDAQDAPVSSYFSQTGDYADIYNGRIESGYNILQYKGLPYYRNADYAEASIIYRNNYYPGQKVRLDLFKEQLILLVPGKQYGIILGSSNVQKVSVYNKTFVWLVPPKESKLNSGYYIQLLAGKNMQLLCKEKYYSLRDLSQNNAVSYFDHEIRYYLLYNNRYYAVKNKGLFTKLFPQYKKQINQFVREHDLDFKQNPDESLTALAAFCEELTNSISSR